MTEPRGEVIYTNFKEPQGTFSLAADRSGRYTYCFSNEMSSYSRKVLRYVASLRASAIRFYLVCPSSGSPLSLFD